MTEKRGFKRRHTIAEAKIKLLKGNTWTDTMLINISRGGMAIYLRKSQLLLAGMSVNGDQSSLYIKILVNYLQIISLMKELKIDVNNVFVFTD